MHVNRNINISFIIQSTFMNPYILQLYLHNTTYLVHTSLFLLLQQTSIATPYRTQEMTSFLTKMQGKPLQLMSNVRKATPNHFSTVTNVNSMKLILQSQHLQLHSHGSETPHQRSYLSFHLGFPSQQMNQSCQPMQLNKSKIQKRN